ncbi:caspase domain-containing protein [Phyllosticta capitalensis]|uniref:caspase domain-containing protein n=1 Tax=Phyllosticta capitalensis TaxID=121624 RepID=UPI00312D25C4
MPQKRALLIGSPWGDLQGPPNDVESFGNFLRRQEFEVIEVCGVSATRKEILHQWTKLIDETGPHDVVVVYYSGHGGLVTFRSMEINRAEAGLSNPRRHQFLLPVDYNDASGTFNGILDVELSVLVQLTTDKTRNVTIVLDCCHSGRMARDPRNGSRAVPKGLPKPKEHDLPQVSEIFAKYGVDPEGFHNLEGNQHAVRIVAAAASETAFEFNDANGTPVGALTSALIPALENALEARLSWRNVMMRAREVVHSQFQQNPHVEGPRDRTVFSLHTRESAALPVTEEDGEVVIMAGRVAQVKERNVYAVMPTNYDAIVEDQVLFEATVKSVTGFRAFLEVPPGRPLPRDGALAFLKTEALQRWPIDFQDDLGDWNDPQSPCRRISNSRFIRLQEPNDNGMVVARIRRIGNRTSLYTGYDVECASFASNDIARHIRGAEQLARAEHFLVVRPDPEELLEHHLKITFRSVKFLHRSAADGVSLPEFGQIGNSRIISYLPEFGGIPQIGVDDCAVIDFENTGLKTIHVSVFNVNVAGKITYMTPSFVGGITLPQNRKYTLGETQHTEGLVGCAMSWPNLLDHVNVPVPERFVFIVTSEPVDLRDFQNSEPTSGRGISTQLEKLARHFSFGEHRDCSPPRDLRVIQWDISNILFSLNR